MAYDRKERQTEFNEFCGQSSLRGYGHQGFNVLSSMKLIVVKVSRNYLFRVLILAVEHLKRAVLKL